jgi:hypothetical protein
MATETIKEFLVGIGFKVDEGSLKKFTSGIKKATVIASGLGAAATAAAGLVTKFVEGTADSFDKLGHLGERVNATAQSIKELGFVASLSGSSTEAVASSLDRFNRTVGEAALGIGRGATAFKELGLTTKRSNGDLKTTTELMVEVGDKIRDMSQQKQVAVLERLGIDPTLVATLTTDVSQLRNEFTQIYKATGIDANKAAKSSENFMDSLARMKFVFTSLKDAIAIKLMPQIKSAIDDFRKLMIVNAPKIIESISPIIDFILKIAKAFVLVVARIAQLSNIIIGWFKKLNDATGGWSTTILAVAAAWKILNLSFLASPLGMILSLIAAVGLLIDDFLVWKEGGDSLIDWGEAFDRIFKTITQTVKDFGSELFGTVLHPIDAWLARFARKKQGVQEFFKTHGRMGGIQLNSDAPLSPSPATANTLSSGNQHINQETKIIVSGGGSPDATGRAVAREQTRVNADMVRNMSGVVR